MERHLVTLQLAAAVVAVEAGPAPVVVGVVGVGRQLQQDLAVPARPAGTDGEIHRAGGLPLAPMGEGAAAVGGGQGHLVIAAAPIGADGKGVGNGPIAALGRSLFRNIIGRPL